MRATLGDPAWMAAHADQIKALLPETWTHIQNMQGEPALRLGFGLKVLGIEWHTFDEFAKCMVYFERVGLMERQGLLVRRGHR